ncbi:MAG: endonuclease [Thiotrichaceae bacterium]|nr:MAG: endonuclease [Thiotrichaceae bacterium]
MQRQPAIYILTNKPNGTLYTGVTSNLPNRIWQHKNKVISGFSYKYNLTLLVYFELYDDMYHAISREKQIKAGSRKNKVMLIEKNNKGWYDLYRDIYSY